MKKRWSNMQTEKKTKKHFIKKFFIGLLSVFFLLLLAGSLYEFIASSIVSKKYPPEGKLVDVGEFNLHLYQQGEGKPTIILETGSGASSTSWGEIPKSLSEYGTVVTYDRGGYGWSEKAETERTGENIVQELYTALKKEGIEGPYLLVGHSLGGMYSRLFAQTYRDEVAGIILLDVRPEDLTKETESIFREAGQDPIFAGTPSKHLLSIFKSTGIARVLSELHVLDIPGENVSRTITIEFREKTFHAIHDELKHLPHLEDDIRQQSLGDLPMTIVTHGIPIDGTLLGLTKEQGNQVEHIWQSEQKQMLELSTNSQLIVAKNSGHNIMTDEPELVVDLVKKMIE